MEQELIQQVLKVAHQHLHHQHLTLHQVEVEVVFKVSVEELEDPVAEEMALEAVDLETKEVTHHLKETMVAVEEFTQDLNHAAEAVEESTLLEEADLEVTLEPAELDQVLIHHSQVHLTQEITLEAVEEEQVETLQLQQELVETLEAVVPELKVVHQEQMELPTLEVVAVDQEVQEDLQTQEMVELELFL